MQRDAMAKWLLITALAFVFGYFGIDKFVHPDIWIGWMPLWLEGLMGFTRDTWLMVAGGIEIILAVLLLAPHRRIRQLAAILIAVHLLGVLTQTGWNDIAIRDIGLLLADLALFFLL